MSQIQFFFLEPASVLKNRKKLKIFLVNSAASTRSIKSLNIIFCNDEYLLSINRKFLNHDYYTDIVTFDLSPSKNFPVEAEIYISLDRVKENATLEGEPYYKELHRVIFHGLLHLMGHGDKTKKEKEQMRKMEDKLIGKYFGA